MTRYHSLAGTHPSLPECLEVSSWIAAGPDGGKGIIMGVRHKEFLVEGVQFHPESILTEEGTTMIRNFLNMRCGTWKEYADSMSPPGELTNGKSQAVNGGLTSKGSVLEEIYEDRRKAVESQKSIPSQRMSDLQAALDMDLAPPLISFPERLRRAPFSLALAAEIKRASPSKGDIAPFICAPAQAKKYALAGASVISVLTEPKWFKGSLEDMRAVRQSLSGMPHRPAVLRKEFIFDEYQILEARLAGADTILLIVKMLRPEVLRRLYDYSKSLGMEPLVEINTPEEMEVALSLEAKVIGINNRNLTTFEVDLGTTSRLVSNLPKDTIICALSGILGAKDVEPYKKLGVGAVLVGEALMRHEDIGTFVKDLMGGTREPVSKPNHPQTMVKICGTRSADAAKAAVAAGADFVGIILVPGRKRTVTSEAALQISKIVHQTPKGDKRRTPKSLEGPESGQGYFEFNSNSLRRNDRALLVGVFQNQALSFIIGQQRLLDLDIVQLHGSEPLEWASLIPVPVVRRFNPGDASISCKPYHSLPLLDSAAGGSGERLDMDSVEKVLQKDPDLRIILAGGLNPENITFVLSELQKYAHQVIAVDVSSGVEEEGVQSVSRIEAFIKAVKK